MRPVIAIGLVAALAASAYGFEMKAFQMREDYGTEPLYECYMNYYYYIPCPTSSWFWVYTGLGPPDVLGVFFTVGDPSMGHPGCNPDYSTCDPYNDHTIEQFRILDYAGYGTLYPGLFTVVFDIWCSDAQGCPVGPSLWNSGPVEFCNAGWNYILVSPNVAVTNCSTQLPSSYPRFLITATSTGADGGYPAWGFDNISTPLERGCAMHDQGCCPALYPRPAVSHYGTIHTGYYGPGFYYCPPLWFLDGRDTSDGSMYGFIELAWRVYLIRSGPDAVERSTWGTIKSMYR
jgi:hypothetical protein